MSIEAIKNPDATTGEGGSVWVNLSADRSHTGVRTHIMMS